MRGCIKSPRVISPPCARLETTRPPPVPHTFRLQATPDNLRCSLDCLNPKTWHAHMCHAYRSVQKTQRNLSAICLFTVLFVLLIPPESVVMLPPPAVCSLRFSLAKTIQVSPKNARYTRWTAVVSHSESVAFFCTIDDQPQYRHRIAQSDNSFFKRFG